MPLLAATDLPPGRRRSLAAVGLGILALLGVAAIGTVAMIESTFGMVHLGRYSLSGPRSWTSGSGQMRVLTDCAGYKLWLQQEPGVIDGT